jgi:histidinol-phosphate aminotransferase
VLANLAKVRAPNDLNAMAILCARGIVAHPEIVDDCVTQAARGGELLCRRATELGLSPMPTRANFMLIRVAHRCPPARVIADLRQLGYLVKGPFQHPSVADCIRVTLGPPALMGQFANALEQALGAVDTRSSGPNG